MSGHGIRSCALSNRDERFVEAAMQELAQGAYAKNESLAFAEIPEFLMSNAEWAWNAGFEAGRASLKDALDQIVRDREHNPKAAPGICDECSRPTFEHEPWCAAAIARAALKGKQAPK